MPDVRENLDGYALRLAEQNGYSRPAWLRDILEIWTPGKGGTKGRPLLSPAGLARLNGSPVSDVFDRLFDAAGVPMPLPGFDVIQRMTRSRPWLCPRCIVEDGIQLAIWELRFCTSCPLHGCRLVTGCPICGQPWRSERGGIDLCDIRACIGKPSQSPAIAVDEAETSVSAWLHELWQPTYGDVARNAGVGRLTGLFPSLDLSDALALVRFLGATPAEAATVNPEAVMNEPLTAVANSGRFLLEGVNGIRHFLLEVERHHADRDHASVHVVLGRHIQHLTGKSSWISSRVRDLVLPLVGEIWDVECALRNAPAVLRRSYAASRKWIAQKDAVRLLGISPRDMRAVAQRAAIETRIVNKKQSKVYLFAVDDIERAARELNYNGTEGRARSVDGHVTCKKVAERLSTRQSVVVALYEKGLIGRVPCRASHLYSMEDAERLIASLDRECEGRTSSDRFPLPSASASMGINLATAVDRATRGDLRLVVAYPDRQGFGRYAVPRSELRRIDDDAGAIMSFNRCMAKLVCRRPLIEELIRKEHLLRETGRLWRGNSDTSLDARSVEQFHATYVTIREVARDMRLSRHAAQALLDEGGIEPALTGLGEQKVYRRAAIQGFLETR